MQKAHTSQPAPRDAALAVIGRLRKEASYDDIMYEMYVLQKIEKGEQDIASGKHYTTEQAQVRLAKWLK